MARVRFNTAVDNRFDGIDFGFVTGEDVVSNTSTRVVGRFDSTIFGEVTLTAIGEGLSLGDGASDFFNAGTLNEATLRAEGRILFSVSDIELPVRQIGDIITGRLIYRGADSIIGSTDADELSGFAGADRINGAGGADLIFGGGGADRLIGGAGSDSILGGIGADRIFGGAGADSRLLGASGRDFINGGGGSDGLLGGGGADSLFGGNGRDTLDGERGADVMTGGNGRDVFVFSRGQDRITDFSAGDKIDLSDQFTVPDFDTLVESNLFDGDDGAVIRISGASVTLEGVAVSELDESDFIFAFSFF